MLNPFKNSSRPDEVFGADSDFGTNWATRLCGKGNLAHRAIYEEVMLGGAVLASRKEVPQFPLQSAFGMAVLDRRQRGRNTGTDEGVAVQVLDLNESPLPASRPERQRLYRAPQGPIIW
jgi:hypothetical protein